MHADLDQARALFIEALGQVPPDQWEAFLAVRCRDDAELRRHVDKLLQIHVEAGSFLDRPAIAAEGAGELQPQADEDRATHADYRAEPGTLISTYKLLEQIGEGGMGTVWMAQQQEPVKRLVAVKLIKAGMDSRQVIARFEAERQALALMDHANIARVLDAGTTGTGRPYFVMDLVRGVPITRYCDEHHLTPRQRLELFIPVCQAVQHAHQKGIIHRDLKPSNVLVALYDGKPVPKVIDFGVAKAAGQQLTEKTLVTGFGSLVGTLEYMSPEQAEVNQLDIDTRSDIYSLGVLLYELLTGSTPFTKTGLEKAGMLEMLRLIREQEPSKPSTKLSTAEGLPTLAANRGTEPAKLTKLVRGELDWIVMKALEKDRSRRYETANGFAMDVQRYLADEAVQACPPSSGYRLRKFVRRYKRALASVVLVVAALVMAVVVLVFSNVWVTMERDQKAQALHDKEAALEKETAALASVKEQEGLAKKNAGNAKAHQRIAEERERTARRHLYAAQINLANQACEVGHVGRALELLERQRPESDREDLRGFEWYYLWRLCHRGHWLTLREHRGSVLCLAYSPEGQTLASGDSDGTVHLWDPRTGRIRGSLTGHDAAVRAVAFSPDGGTLASGSSDKTVRLWDVSTGQLRATLSGHSAQVGSVAFSPDGKRLAVSAGSGSWGAAGELKLWDVSSGNPKATLSGQYSLSIAFAPDGKTLAAGGWQAKVELWDLATGQIRATLPQRLWVGSVAFSPDGKTLASGGGENAVELWDPMTAELRATLRGHSAGVTSVAFAPRGNRLASGSTDGTVRLWDPAKGQKRAFPHLGPVHAVAFSPDGAFLASASGDRTIKLWDLTVEDTEPPLQAYLPGITGMIWSLAFSPDDKTLVSTADGSKSVKIWHVATRREQTDLRLVHDPISLLFSQDGRTLATGCGLRDVATMKERFALKHANRCVWALAFSPDGKTLASGSWDNSAALWDVTTGQEKARFDHASCHAVAFSPDGRTLATGSGTKPGTVIIWDLATKQARLTLPGHENGIMTVAFSPDGNSLAAIRFDGSVTKWDPITGREQLSFRGDIGHANMRGAAFLSNWERLAIGCGDGTVRLWDPRTGEHVTDLKGHTQEVYAAAFSWDRRTLATGSTDGVVRLWHSATEEEVRAQSSVDDGAPRPTRLR